MKSIFTKLSLFVLFTVAISGLTSCSDSSTSVKDPPADEAAVPPGNRPVKTEEEKKNSPNYRPIEKAVDEAEVKKIDGSAFRVVDKRGKVVLLNLWATWCGPCRAEMPALVRMQEEYRDRDFEVIGLNTDDETVE